MCDGQTARMNAHRKLVAWEKCRELVREVYGATAEFPAAERFGLTSQLRRASVSAASNIAEGFARLGPRETAHGLSLTLGSLAEIDTLLVVAQDLGYLSAATAAALQERRDMAAKVTFGLQRKMRARIPA